MKSTDSLKKRILAAKGVIPFDKLFVNMKLIDVYGERVIENASLGVCGGVIVSVCPSFEPQAEEKVDCGGMYAAPSFIDCHMHIESSHLSPSAYCEGAVPHGTGCIFTDPMQLANAAGEAGLRAFCSMLENQPVHSFLQFSSRVPAAEGMETSGAYFSPEDTLLLMKKLSAVSLGEVNALELEKQSVLEKLAFAADNAFHINGHCPKLDHDSLCAAAAAGIMDDHESETGEELSQRLLAGIPIFIREGTIEPNCAPLVLEIVKKRLPTDSIMFCTDDKSPCDILKNGCIDNNIRIAISCGMDPVTAIKAATLNAARHFGLEHRIGSCTPGRYADIVLFETLEYPEIARVYFKGELAAENGRIICCERNNTSDSCYGLYHTVKLPESLSEDSLAVSSDKGKGLCGRANVVYISMTGGSLISHKGEETLTVSEGRIIPDTKKDILPIAVIERFGKNGNIGKAFIKGLGIKRGAVASSTAQEGNNIVVSGADYSDMLAAVRAVADAGGGSAIVCGGRLIALRRLPMAGIMGTGSIKEEAESAKRFEESLKMTGSDNPMLMAMLTVSLCPSIPEIGLTDKGLIDVYSRENIQPINEYFSEFDKE